MPDREFTVGSLFTGVGGVDLGLERAGCKIAFQCEVDPWRRRVLARHWPHVPCYHDVRALRGEELPHVHLLCGGFPCQDLSVAGRRAGLEGERSGLFYEFARLADELVRPGGYVLIENVPGLLSSPGRDKETGIDRTGRDFAIILATLADLGFHDLAYRVLDSRFFGVPQRRRRVYILARRARGSVCREVLLESAGGGGDLETSWEARARDPGGARAGVAAPGVAAPLTRGSAVGAGVSVPGRRQEDDVNLVANGITGHYGKGPDSDATDTFVVPAVTAKWAKHSGGPAGDECQNLVTDERSVSEQIDDGDLTQGLTTRFGTTGADLPDAEAGWLIRTNQTGANGGNIWGGECPTLDGGTPPAVFREAPRSEHGGRPRDVGGSGHGADAELGGARGRERGACDGGTGCDV
jgi:DNA-cytosine methyltransferase